MDGFYYDGQTGFSHVLGDLGVPAGL